MGKQHYVIVDKDELRQAGDLFWCPASKEWLPTGRVGKVGKGLVGYIRPVDPVPVNPWIKGSDRLPTLEDAWRNVVEMWNGTSAVYYAFGQVKEDDWWRPIDQTPPPAEPTVEEETEKLFGMIERSYFYNDLREQLKVVRAKQESEGANDN